MKLDNHFEASQLLAAFFEYIVYACLKGLEFVGKITDENAFQWINKGNQSQMYEVQGVAEQAAFPTNMTIPQNSQQVCLTSVELNKLFVMLSLIAAAKYSAATYAESISTKRAPYVYASSLYDNATTRRQCEHH